VGALWNDRFGAGNLLARLDDGQLYYADDTRTVPNGQNASWRCIDPTPGDPTDVVSWVESVRGSGQYLVATNASTSSGDVGAVYLVNLGKANKAGSGLSLATILAPPGCRTANMQSNWSSTSNTPGSRRWT
jgi:hypothetical protein